jgi:hypothetical protein
VHTARGRVLTLGALVDRPELRLRFADEDDQNRKRKVEAVIQGTRALDTDGGSRTDALREVLVVLGTDRDGGERPDGEGTHGGIGDGTAADDDRTHNAASTTTAAGEDGAADRDTNTVTDGIADPGPSAGDPAGSDDEDLPGRIHRLAAAHVAGVVLAGYERAPEPVAAAARRHGVPLLCTREDPARTWVRIFRVMRQEHRQELRRQADRVKSMRSLAMEPDGLRGLLRWLARQLDGHAVLVGTDRRPLHSSHDEPTELLERARGDIERVIARRVSSAGVDVGAQVAHIQAIGDDEPGAALVVVRDEPFTPRLRAVISDATGYLWLRWRLEELGRRGRQVDLADMQSREAILHLLILGNVQGAQRVTAALGAPLPEVTRVYIMECPARLRDDYARMCTEVTQGRAWLVRCPVYAHHLIILAPVEADDSLDRALRSLASNRPDCYVGAGQTVALRDTAEGYEQAFHALAVAHGVLERCATFSAREEITTLLGPGGHRWATATLWPLLDHRPERRQDPDADELKATLTSWLAFSSRAARQLKIHRNTLTARLRYIQRLLDRDLSELGTLAELHLALRLLDRPQPSDPGGGGEVPLRELLETPEVLNWAQARLSPLDDGDRELRHTLRAWLASNTRLDVTAAALGLSVPAARKRLVRIEGVLGRSLLNPPSARYDLALALRILDSHAAPPERGIA